MVVANVDPLASFLVTVAPFIVVDIVKIVAATAVARTVIRALPRS
jgi:biotin transporter BioY